MNVAKEIYESDEHGVVHIEVPVGRSRQRVEVLVVWEDVADAGESPPDEQTMADLVGLLEGVDLENACADGR